MRRLVCLGLVVVAAAWSPSLARAQAARIGATFSLGGTTSPVTDPDIAYDSVNNRFLQVAGKGWIEGHLLNANGGVIGNIAVRTGGDYAQDPRVAFGSAIPGGGYLVTWHEGSNGSRVMGRIFRGDGAALTGAFPISGMGSNWTMGATAAYSPTSREFLVAWMGGYTTTNDIFVQRVNEAGGLLGGPILISAGSPDWEREPSVAYNPYANEFMVAYAGYNEGGRYGFVGARRVQAGSGQVMGPSTVVGAAVSTYVASVAFNVATGQYLLGWYNRTSGGASVYGVTLDAAGNQVGAIRVLSPFYSAYDALDIDYNVPSGQFLLVTHGGGATPWEDAAVNILSSGVAYDNGFILTNTAEVRALRSNPGTTEGNYNPRVASRDGDKVWLAVTSSNFAATHAQFAFTTGGGGTTTPPPPTAPTSRPAISLDVPTDNASVQSQFAVSGWAVDLGATSGTGVSAVHVWAFPNSGAAPVFLGAATLGYARGDVGAYFGDGRFSAAGFGLAASLPPGSYNVQAFALSAVANAFNAVAAKQITVTAPISIPKMYVEAPAQSQTVTQYFNVAGWAIDQASTNGAGVDAIHVWGYPINGAAPIFAGAGTLGHARPDVAGVFGSNAFYWSGFGVRGTLPPGEYNLVVFAHSSITGTFNQAAVVRIRVV